MDKKTICLLLFLSATGLTAGCFFEIYLSGNGKDQLMNLLSGFFTSGSPLGLWDAFRQNIQSSLLPLILLFFSLKFSILFIPTCFWIFFRGIALGFSAAIMMETFGVKGIFYVITTLAPCGMGQLLILSVLFSCTVQHRRRIHGNRKALQIFAGQYLYDYAAGLGLLIFLGVLQSVLLLTVT